MFIDLFYIFLHWKYFLDKEKFGDVNVSESHDFIFAFNKRTPHKLYEKKLVV